MAGLVRLTDAVFQSLEQPGWGLDSAISLGAALDHISYGNDADMDALLQKLTEKIILARAKGKYLGSFRSSKDECHGIARLVLVAFLSKRAEVFLDRREGGLFEFRKYLNQDLQRRAHALEQSTHGLDDGTNWRLAQEQYVNEALKYTEDVYAAAVKRAEG